MSLAGETGVAWHADDLLIRRQGMLVMTGLAVSETGIMGNLFYDLAETYGIVDMD